MDSEDRLSSHAIQIWQTGVDAVRADRLVENVLQLEGDRLVFDNASIDVTRIGKIAVVGGGKGGARMASAVERVIGPRILAEKVSGWVNVPEGCRGETQQIHLHAARPAGINEPTAAGVVGSEKILQLVGDLHAEDLCLVLISGGGSALLPAPQPPITLEDLLQVTRLLMSHRTTINELHTVRTCLSRIKGGGLVRGCRAGMIWGLIISDVVGDPPAIIASGPTVTTNALADEALRILNRIDSAEVPKRVMDFLTEKANLIQQPPACAKNVVNRIIGNNATAVTAAIGEAKRLGYEILSLGSDNQGEASEEGSQFALRCQSLQRERREQSTPLCILSGGEPVVDLSSQPGKGGRNQQFVLAALNRLFSTGMQGITILSGGTDGEDGPTDAAGAVANASLIRKAQTKKMNPQDFLNRYDAYRFFEPLEGLLFTGPTHTNVMDIRVAIVE